MAGWPDAAQDRLPADVPGTRRAVLVFRADRWKDAEMLVLRHENAVLRRNIGRVRFEPVGCQKSACLVSCGDALGVSRTAPHRPARWPARLRSYASLPPRSEQQLIFVGQLLPPSVSDRAGP